MSNVRRVFRQVTYLPLLPESLNKLVYILKRIGWLRGPEFPTSKVRRILVALPHNSLGDLVLTVPFLQQLNHLWPEALIDVVVGDKMAAFIHEIPLIERVIKFVPASSAPPIARYRDVIRLLALVRRENLMGVYDIAIDPRWDSDGYGYLSRALLYLSGAKTRVAYSGFVDEIDPSLDGFLTHVAEGGVGEHELLRKLRMLQRAGVSEEEVEDDAVLQVSAAMIQLAQSNAAFVDRLLREAGLDREEGYAILSPAATSPRRMWPTERLAAVAGVLHAQYGFRFLAVGGPGDVSFAEQVAVLQPGAVISIAGKTNISQLVALFGRAILFIGNDSGPAHISGILGRNTVVVSPFPLSCDEDHVNAPMRFRPCGPRVRIVQPRNPLSPCESACSAQTAHCIGQITAAEVISACKDLLRV